VTPAAGAEDADRPAPSGSGSIPQPVLSALVSVGSVVLMKALWQVGSQTTGVPGVGCCVTPLLNLDGPSFRDDNFSHEVSDENAR
jgi:hypothetical protein